MCWEPLAEWGPLDSDFGDLSPPPTSGKETAELWEVGRAGGGAMGGGEQGLAHPGEDHG